MPYELAWEERGFVCRIWGQFTSGEYNAWSRGITSDPRYENSIYGLDIFADSTVIKASSDALRQDARTDAELSHHQPMRATAIVGSQMAIKGLMNLYRIQHEATGGLWKTAYFETEEEARRWLAETLDQMDVKGSPR